MFQATKHKHHKQHYKHRRRSIEHELVTSYTHRVKQFSSVISKELFIKLSAQSTYPKESELNIGPFINE